MKWKISCKHETIISAVTSRTRWAGWGPIEGALYDLKLRENERGSIIIAFPHVATKLINHTKTPRPASSPPLSHWIFNQKRWQVLFILCVLTFLHFLISGSFMAKKALLAVSEDFSATIAFFPYKFHPRAHAKAIFETEAEIPGNSCLKIVWQGIIFTEMRNKGALIACSHILHTTRQGVVTNICTNKSPKRNENQLVKLRKIYSRLFLFHFFSGSVLWKHLSESVGVCIHSSHISFSHISHSVESCYEV